jgi:hypothetical protein
MPLGWPETKLYKQFRRQQLLKTVVRFMDIAIALHAVQGSAFRNPAWLK